MYSSMFSVLIFVLKALYRIAKEFSEDTEIDDLC